MLRSFVCKAQLKTYVEIAQKKNFLMYLFIILFNIDDYVCCFSVTGLPSPRGLSFAFQSNSPFLNEFTLATLRLHENNFLDGLRRKWWDSASKCPDEEQTSKNDKPFWEEMSDLLSRAVLHKGEFLGRVPKAISE